MALWLGDAELVRQPNRPLVGATSPATVGLPQRERGGRRESSTRRHSLPLQDSASRLCFVTKQPARISCSSSLRVISTSHGPMAYDLWGYSSVVISGKTPSSHALTNHLPN
ncbi:hypothetical protein AAC387_Pa02g1169 [Persea americana]